MRVLRLALLFPLILALGGCLGSDYSNTSPEKLAAKISVKEDRLDNVLRFRAPNLSAGLDNTFQIRTTMDRENGYAAHVVYVKDPFFVANRGGYEQDGRAAQGSQAQPAPWPARGPLPWPGSAAYQRSCRCGGFQPDRPRCRLRTTYTPRALLRRPLLRPSRRMARVAFRLPGWRVSRERAPSCTPSDPESPCGAITTCH